MRYCIFIIVMLFFNSCIKDTCNKRLGDTFESVEFLDATITDNKRMVIRFELMTLDTLPISYFTDGDIRSAREIDSTFIDKNELVIFYNDNQLPAVGESISNKIVADFRDRRRYIDCQHGGSDDSYTLDVIWTVTNVDNVSLSVTGIEWFETFFAGHY